MNKLLKSYDEVIKHTEERLNEMKGLEVKVGNEIASIPQNIDLNKKIETLMHMIEKENKKINAVPLVKMHMKNINNLQIKLSNVRQELYSKLGINSNVERMINIQQEINVVSVYLKTLIRDKEQIIFKGKLEEKKTEEVEGK